MHEVELKFQVPAESQAAVQRALATRTAQRTRLKAIYFDTPDRHLAKANVALRLRQEGRRWVQTLKASGAHAMERLEHNVPLPVLPIALLRCEPQRHDGTPAAAVLARALDGVDANNALVERYRTDITRVHRSVRAAPGVGGVVELAFDSGRIVTASKALAVCELEVELVRGTPLAVIDVARRWVRRYGVWLDTRTKSDRGDNLAQGFAVGPARRVGRSPLRRGMTPDAAVRAAITDTLAQILPNASEVASGEHEPDHVHQLRVGLRRLRSLIRFTDGWSRPFDPALGSALATLFAGLGGARDRDALAATLQPALEAAGAPLVELPPTADSQNATRLLRAPATTTLWLSLIENTLDVPAAAVTEITVLDPPQAPPEAGLKDLVGDALHRWHRRVVKARKAFASLPDDARHQLRKRVKRLRYAAEFAAPLYPAKAVAKHLDALRELQEQLGHFNDLCVAAAAYQRMVDDDARAWFAIGWIASRREQVLADCVRALREYSRAAPFWRQRHGSA